MPEAEVPSNWLAQVYPEPSHLFDAWLRPLAESIEDCVVVLDTNVLLTPYTISPKSLDEIGATLRKLIEEDRLRIPIQVAREFANNRPGRIQELYQQLARKRDGQRDPTSGRYPLLESVPEYIELLDLEQELSVKQREYRAKIGQLLEHVRSWTWNDPVSALYSSLFGASVLVESDLTGDPLKKEVSRRRANRIPPGYKDSSKDDGGIGDILIWLAILNLARTTGRDLLLVTAEEKSDWWHRSEKQTLFPRYELAEEYRRESGGRSFHIAKFSEFLDLFGTEASAVAEVKEEESEFYSLSYDDFTKKIENAEIAGVNWAKRRYGADSIQFPGGSDLDLLIRDADGDIIGVKVEVVPGSIPDLFRDEIENASHRGSWLREKYLLTVYAIVIIADDLDNAANTMISLAAWGEDLPETHFHVGYLGPRNSFVEVQEVRVGGGGRG